MKKANKVRSSTQVPSNQNNNSRISGGQNRTVLVTLESTSNPTTMTLANTSSGTSSAFITKE